MQLSLNQINSLPYYISSCGEGSVPLYDTITGKYTRAAKKCKSYFCPRCLFDKKSWLEDHLKYYVPEHKAFVFLTVTTKSMDNPHMTRFCNKIIFDVLRPNMDLKSCRSKNKYNEDEARQMIERKIKEFIEIDIETESRIYVTKKSKIEVARRHGIFYVKQSKAESSDFDNEYRDEIDDQIRIELKCYKSLLKNETYYYRKDEEGKKEEEKIKIYFPSYNELPSIIEKRIKSMYLDIDNYKLKDIEYFWVKELQKRGSPHRHMLLNCYIPHAVMKKAIYSQNKSGDYVFYDCRIYKEILLNEILGFKAEKSVNSVVNYILKYITKGLDSFNTLNAKGRRFGKSRNFFGGIGLYKNYEPKRYIRIQETRSWDEGTKINRKYIVCGDKLEDLINPKHFQIKENKAFQQMNIAIENLPDELKNQYNDPEFKINHLLGRCMQESNLTFDADYVSSLVKNRFESNGKEFNDEHKSIIKAFCESKKLLFLEALAGTGKTELITTMINLITENNLIDSKDVGFFAFMGRTADMLSSKVSGVECSTIHRAGGSFYNGEFYNNGYNCLSVRLAVVDEITLITPELFLQFLSMISPDTKIIVLGNDSQNKDFTSIKGRTLDSFLKNSPYVDVVSLSKNFRSGDEVMKSVEDFQNGVVFPLKPLEIVGIRYNEVRKEGLKPMNIANDRNTVRRINEYHLKGKGMKIGCPVICNRNYYSKGVFNGRIGEFVEKRENSTVVVYKINGKDVLIEFFGAEQLHIEPAYAITCRKSQGSEFNHVIAYYGSHAIGGEKVNNRNSVYTALTRAKYAVELYFEDLITREQCYAVSF